MNLSIEQLFESPLNPRKTFDLLDLAELAASIKEQGVLQPLTVRPAGPLYEVVIGARRYRASKMAGVTEVPVVVRELSDEQTLEVMLVENSARSDVSPIEEADAMLALAEKHGRDAKYIADKIGRSDDLVRRRLQLARLLPEFRELLAAQRIGIGGAELLAACTLDLQRELADTTLAIDKTDWRGDLCHWGRIDVRRAIGLATRRLCNAPWDLSEEGLAGRHPCTGCLERSSCQPSLLAEFADDDDRCLNVECWSSKEAAWVAAETAAGTVVLTGEKAAAAAGPWSSNKSLRRADHRMYFGDETIVPAEVAPNAKRVIALTDAGPVVLIQLEDVVQALEEGGRTDLADKITGKTVKRAREEERAKSQADQARIDQLIASVVAAAETTMTDDLPKWLGWFVAGAVHVLNQDPLVEVCKRRGWEVPVGEHNTKHPDRAVQAHLEAMPVEERQGLLAELLLRSAISIVERGLGYGNAPALVEELRSCVPDPEPADIYGDVRFTSPDAAELYIDLSLPRLLRTIFGQSPLRKAKGRLTGGDLLADALKTYSVKELREVLVAWKGPQESMRKAELIEALCAHYQATQRGKGVA